MVSRSVDLQMPYEEHAGSDSFVGTNAELDEQYGAKHQQDNHSFQITQLDALKMSNVNFSVVKGSVHKLCCARWLKIF